MNNYSNRLKLLLILVAAIIISRNTYAGLSVNDISFTISVYKCDYDTIQLLWSLENLSDNNVKILTRWWDPNGNKVNNFNFYYLEGEDTIWADYYNIPPNQPLRERDFTVLGPYNHFEGITPPLRYPWNKDMYVGFNSPMIYFVYAIYSTEELTGWDCWKGTLISNTTSFYVYELLGINNTNWRALKSLSDYKNLENLIRY